MGDRRKDFHPLVFLCWQFASFGLEFTGNIAKIISIGDKCLKKNEMKVSRVRKPRGRRSQRESSNLIRILARAREFDRRPIKISKISLIISSAFNHRFGGK